VPGPFVSVARRSRRRLRGALLVALGIVVLVCGLAAFFGAVALAERGTLPRGTTIGGVDVGGISEAEARAREAVALLESAGSARDLGLAYANLADRRETAAETDEALELA